jgi:hypothetical protein
LPLRVFAERIAIVEHTTQRHSLVQGTQAKACAIDTVVSKVGDVMKILLVKMCCSKRLIFQTLRLRTRRNKRRQLILAQAK